MSKEICVSSTPHETRLAILEDDQLTEVYYERENEYTLAGSIYKGRVTRVLPGMQSAFVDLGLERDAFLYVTDFMEEQEDSSDFERIPATGEDAGRQGSRASRHAIGLRVDLERDAFLYVTDFMEEQEDSSDFERISTNGEENGRAAQGRETQNRPQRPAERPAEDEPRRNGAPSGAPAASGPGGQRV